MILHSGKLLTHAVFSVNYTIYSFMVLVATQMQG